MSPLGFSWGAKKRRSPRRGRAMPKWGAKKARTPTVRSLAAKVNKIAKMEKDHICRVYYSQSDTLNLGTATGAQPSQIVPLTTYSYWTRTFGTDADDEQAKKAVIRKSTTEWSIDSNGELDSVGYTMFVVSLKKNASALIDNTGALIPSFTSGTHYTGTGSRVLLNLNYFNVHYVKRRLTGDIIATRFGANSAGAVSYPNMPNKENFKGRIRLAYNKGKGLAVQNPKGDWKAAGYPQDDCQNYFILVFCDDSTLDGVSPQLKYNTLHSVDVVG